MQEGYSICFNEWALDSDVKNELRLLLIISSLSAETGYCYASNKYFADLFNETERSISKKIKTLEKKNYISVGYKKRGTQITSRLIYLTRTKNFSTDHRKNFLRTIEKNFQENNISNNNISNNNKENIKRKFVKPTIEEIDSYCKERNNEVDAQRFYDFYETNGWVQGKNKPIKDWKACVRTWERKKQTQSGIKPSWLNKEIQAEKSNVIVTKEELEYVGITK